MSAPEGPLDVITEQAERLWYESGWDHYIARMNQHSRNDLRAQFRQMRDFTFRADEFAELVDIGEVFTRVGRIKITPDETLPDGKIVVEERLPEAE